MDNKMEYFITAVEEKSISKAAERLFVSQQCISSAIKNIEDEYNCRLIIRKPQFILTEAGETYYNKVKQIKMLESDLNESMKDAISGQTGTIAVGIHLSRAPMIMSHVMPIFWKSCPKVAVNISDGQTLSFEKNLDDGLVDVIFAMNPSDNEKNEKVFLNEEKMFLAISDELMKKYFKENFYQSIERFSKGVSLNEFTGVPFIRRSPPNNSYTTIDAYLINNGIKLETIMQSNNALLRMDLCSKGYGATIINELRYAETESYHIKNIFSQRIHVFPINGIPPLKHYVVYKKDGYRSKYVKIFAESAKEGIRAMLK